MPKSSRSKSQPANAQGSATVFHLEDGKRYRPFKSVKRINAIDAKKKFLKKNKLDHRLVIKEVPIEHLSVWEVPEFQVPVADAPSSCMAVSSNSYATWKAAGKEDGPIKLPASPKNSSAAQAFADSAPTPPGFFDHTTIDPLLLQLRAPGFSAYEVAVDDGQPAPKACNEEAQTDASFLCDPSLFPSNRLNNSLNYSHQISAFGDPYTSPNTSDYFSSRSLLAQPGFPSDLFDTQSQDVNQPYAASQALCRSDIPHDLLSYETPPLTPSSSSSDGSPTDLLAFPFTCEPPYLNSEPSVDETCGSVASFMEMAFTGEKFMDQTHDFLSPVFPQRNITAHFDSCEDFSTIQLPQLVEGVKIAN